MNNKGDMTWSQYDPVTGVNQVYGLIDGVVTQVTFDSVQHYETSINDAGEIVWLQTDVGSATDQIFSNKRGQLTNGCQSQLIPGMVWPKINNCGDVVFIAYDPEVGNKLFRLGNAAPCGSVPEPNDSQQTAVQVKDHSTNVGVLDQASSPVDWYSITGMAGEQITVSVNWSPGATPPNQFRITLRDSSGQTMADISGLESPSILRAIAPYGGTYYVRIETIGGTVGYALTLTVGTGGGACADALASVDAGIYPGISINALGESVWSQNDPITGFVQIFSSTKGQLTTDPSDHIHPSLNIHGDVVWEQNGQIFGILNGAMSDLSADPSANHFQPTMNDLQEVVWIRSDFSGSRLFSNRRGFLTDADVFRDAPHLNNRGDVVWQQYDELTKSQQIYGLVSGVMTQLTNDSAFHQHPSMNEVGELVWSQWPNYGGDRIFSSVRGQVTYDCPYGAIDHAMPVINSCGDIVFIGRSAMGGWFPYRLGKAAPCVPDTIVLDAQNDAPLNTTIVSNSITVAGLSGMTPITVSGGEYEINGNGLWTGANGKVSNGDTVRVRQTSSSQYSTTTEAILTIGGGMAAFRVTTRANTPPPTIVITSPVPGITMDNRPLLAYTASAGTVVVTVDNAVVAKASGDRLDLLADGIHTVRVDVTDTFGQKSSVSVIFTVDTTAPFVSITSPAAGLTNNKTPLLTFSVSDGVVVVKVDGAVVGKVSGNTLDALADGNHTVRVEATDAAGNMGVAEVSVTVDTVPPALSIDPVPSPVKDTYVTIKGRREMGSTVTVSISPSAVVGPVSYVTDTTWTCTISGLKRKTAYTVTATARDAAGNAASAGTSFKLK
jgi:hypothetical protein